MANDTYKKRAKGSWNQGKGCKGDSEERQFAKKEVEDAVKYDYEENALRHKGKRKRNLKASLEYRISWYAQKIEEYQRADRGGSFINYLRDGLKKAEEEYKKKYGNKE